MQRTIEAHVALGNVSVMAKLIVAIVKEEK